MRQIQGDWDGAIAQYKRTIELEPKFVVPHFNLGAAPRLKSDLDGAVAYKRVIEIDPKYAAAHNNLGVGYLHSGSTQRPSPARGQRSRQIRSIPTGRSLSETCSSERAISPARGRR